MPALLFHQDVTGLRFLTLSYPAPSDSGRRGQPRVKYTILVTHWIWILMSPYEWFSVLSELDEQIFLPYLFFSPPRWHHRTQYRRGHVGPVERRDVDGWVRPRLHPLHAGIRPGRHPVQHPGLPHDVLHRTRLRQGNAARGRHATHGGRRFLRLGHRHRDTERSPRHCTPFFFPPWPLTSSMRKTSVPDHSKFKYSNLEL